MLHKHPARSRLARTANLSRELLAQLGIPHTLRHSSITWYCRIIGKDFGDGRLPLTVEDVSEIVGVTVAELERTYRHEFPDSNAAIMKASFSFGKAT